MHMYMRVEIHAFEYNHVYKCMHYNVGLETLCYVILYDTLWHELLWYDLVWPGVAWFDVM